MISSAKLVCWDTSALSLLSSSTRWLRNDTCLYCCIKSVLGLLLEVAVPPKVHDSRARTARASSSGWSDIWRCLAPCAV